MHQGVFKQALGIIVAGAMVTTPAFSGQDPELSRVRDLGNVIEFIYAYGDDRLEFFVPVDPAQPVVIGANGHRYELSPGFYENQAAGFVSPQDKQVFALVGSHLLDPDGVQAVLEEKLVSEGYAITRGTRSPFTLYTSPEDDGCNEAAGAGLFVGLGVTTIGCAVGCAITAGLGCLVCAGAVITGTSGLVLFADSCNAGGGDPGPGDPGCDPASDPDACTSCNIETCADGLPPLGDCTCPGVCPVGTSCT